MEQKTILLLNVVAIQFISIFSDYWISIKFRTSPPPNCQLQHSSQIGRLVCGNISYTLVHQHANLFRQCNDVSENCHWFITFQSYLARGEQVESNFVQDAVALLLSLIAPVYALLGYFFSKKANGVIRALSVSTFASAAPIVITMFIIHSTNTQEPRNEEQFLYYTEADWSLYCAALGSFLMGLTTHVCMVEHRHSVERQLSQRRRRQLHNALMSSCRQDIAMAIRARMTVI
ncbi:hypothetical protein GCK72_009634 [Caenorhabditis remanei]|uniref:Uncharacterized protein n=1 Tax=Caenorhabditis remanei TaxID=31234 RepID=A0A6A5H0X7_CAERE|nr:hypothetical protein GCK72_009634 [Caenorhabditis remanei]KAF1761378.1 hypothetical protein GCK72_009634 [Caenorhabditis remanei]